MLPRPRSLSFTALLAAVAATTLGAEARAAAQGTPIDTAYPTRRFEGAGLQIAVGDLDQDGALDVVTASGTGALVRRGLGDAELGSVTMISLQVAFQSDAIGDLAVADLDGDGVLDLAGAMYELVV